MTEVARLSPIVRPAHVLTPQGDYFRLLDHYGRYESFGLPTGETVHLLPTCTLENPLFSLNKANWLRKTSMGNFRRVYSVDELSDGTHPGIVVKSPERTFTRDVDLLRRNYPWWGGRRTMEGKISLGNNPAVESQTVAEALILLELHRHNIRAEIPQAIIENADHTLELVVKEIPTPYNARALHQAPSARSIEEATGLKPANDYGQFNFITDDQGQEWIIDVNRWEWPRHFDTLRSGLVQAIREALSEENRFPYARR